MKIIATTNAHLEKLVRQAISLGAGDAKAIDSSDIRVDDHLAELCNASGCKNYGMSPSCPPHVTGPEGFRELQRVYPHAIIFRIDVPSAVLHSDERKEVTRLLHEVAAGVEQAAVRTGHGDSKAFAGGSCKASFCHGYDDCRVLSAGGECRYPDLARPSMSGFGINVLELMKTCGWPANISTPKAAKDDDALSWMAGLILVGR